MGVVHLTKDGFKKIFFDYETSKEWEYKGENPCIIDFYADWCGPCKAVAPIMEELAEEYHCNVDFYDVDTGIEQELAAVFGIRSIPSLLFVPKVGEPKMAMGALPKETFQQFITEIFNLEVCR